MLGRLLLLCAAAAATRNESVLDLAPRFAERASAPSSVDDDGELEISAFKVNLVASQSSCKITGSQKMTYNFVSGEYSAAQVEIGDDVSRFYTKSIESIECDDFPKDKLVVKRRDYTRCKCVLGWSFPKTTAPAQKTFTLNFDMEPHVVRNGSETFNEIRFSTGESYKAAIKAIEVSIILPKAFGSDDIVISSSSGSKQWDQTAKEAKFTRSTYTPPGTRYTVSVRYPSTAATDKCNPCSKLPDWLMYVLLSPLVLCFIIPCFASLIHRDQDGSGGGGGGGGGGDFASLDEEDDPSGGPLT